MLWNASEYARAARLPLRTARYHLARWFAQGDAAVVRVVREQLPATGDAPPRQRYLLDVASWRAATGCADAA